MARIRTVKPEFWGHSKTAKVSREARLLFLALLNDADDEGRLLGSPKRLAGVAFPHDDDVDSGEIREWLRSLSDAGFVDLYEVEGIAYIQVRGFGEHQKVSHPTPSRLPGPEMASDQQECPPENFRRDSGAAPESFRPDLGSRNRDLGTGKTPLALVSDPSFEDFWRAYPKKADKNAAEKAWKKVTKTVPPQRVVDAARAYAEDPQRDPNYTKNAATWLNAGSYDNDYKRASGDGVSYDSPPVRYT